MKNNKTNKQCIKSLIELNAPKNTELVYGTDENSFTVNVCPILPFSKRVEMIREIVNGVFLGDRDSVDTYMPEFLELLQKYSIVKYYSDFPLPNKIDDAWMALNYTGIYEDIVNVIGKENVIRIYEVANCAIDTYRSYLTTKTDTNKLFKNIRGMLGKITSKISKEDLDKIISNLKGISNQASIQDVFTSLFGNENVQEQN